MVLGAGPLAFSAVLAGAAFLTSAAFSTGAAFLTSGAFSAASATTSVFAAFGAATFLVFVFSAAGADFGEPLVFGEEVFTSLSCTSVLALAFAILKYPLSIGIAGIIP